MSTSEHSPVRASCAEVRWQPIVPRTHCPYVRLTPCWQESELTQRFPSSEAKQRTRRCWPVRLAAIPIPEFWPTIPRPQHTSIQISKAVALFFLKVREPQGPLYK